MRLKTCITALIVWLSASGIQSVFAQQAAKIPRVLILLDGSSSMNEEWSKGKSRFREAGHFILALIDSMHRANASVEFGLRVFGHQYPAQQKNCYDTKKEIMFSRWSRDQMQTRLESLHGYGVSPIAFSLSEAAEQDFENENKYAYSIVLVTDGGESCDGDICKVVHNLLQRKIFFRPYIVSLVDYAPLRELYACLGTFLTVSKEAEVPVTVDKIVDAHREGFERAKTGTTRPVFYRDSMPEVKTTPVIPPKDTTPVAVKVPARDNRVIRQLRIPVRLKVFMAVTVEVHQPEKLPVPPFVMSAWTPDPVPAAPVIAPVPVKTPEPVPVRKKEKTITRLKLADRKALKTLILVMPSPKKLPVPPFVLSKQPEITKAPEIPVVKKSNPSPANDTKTTPYTIEKTPAAETLLEVYFTDGNGKYYASSPQILLTDPASGKVAHKFYRTVDPGGNPDPQKLPAGTYNLSVAGSDRTFLRDVVINANSSNKVIITVTNGSLQFAYTGKNAKKPVDKYFAIVKRNFEPLPVVKQRCDTQLLYPPGNYHIEVNTLPPTVYSVDLSFGVTVMLPVAEPGTLVFSNTDNLGKVRLFYPLGDKFVQFHSINITGDASRQQAELKPGIYQVYYSLGPGLPEKVLTFHIRSNEAVNIELK